MKVYVIHRGRRDRSTQSTKLAFEFVFGEDECGGATVGAVVRVVDKVSLGEQRVDLFGREAMARFDGRFAGHHVQQRIEQVAAIGLLFGLIELLGEVADQLRQVGFRQHDRIAVDQDCLPTELTDAKAELIEDFVVLQQQCGFLRSQFDGFWHEHSLRFDGVIEDSRTQVLVHDSFVERVLINNSQTFVGFDDDVRVTNLHRPHLAS